MPHVARKFERLLKAYRREGGGEWSGVELERATGGVVTRSYVTNLRKGRIENPGMDKLWATAKAMGFPPALWFEEEISGADGRGAAGRPEGLAGRVERLFDVIKDPKTGSTYTNSRIARMSLGDITEEDVEGLRSGSVADPPLEPRDRPGEGLRRRALLPGGRDRRGGPRSGDRGGPEGRHD